MSDDSIHERLGDFLSVSPDVFWETDTTGRLTFLSMQITPLTGKAHEEFIGKPLTTLFAHKPCADLWSNWVHACIKGKLLPLEAMPVPIEGARVAHISAYAQRFSKGLRGFIRDVSEIIEGGSQAVEIGRQLADTIDAVPYGVAMFDRNDILIFINNKCRNIFPGIQDIMCPGTSFEQLVRGYFNAGLQDVPPQQREEMVRKRLSLHRNDYGTREILLRGDQWVQISEHTTESGNVVVSWSDITNQKRRELALSSLLSDPNEAFSVPERAAKAVAVALGCRWGAVVRLDDDIRKQKSRIVALWDNDHFVEPFDYNYIGTPCEKVYRQGGYVHLPSTAEFRFPHLMEDKGLISYQGMALRDQAGSLIGHIFAMDDHATIAEYRYGREVFHLIANWVEMEFRRQELHASITAAQKRFRDFAEVASDWFWEMGPDFNFKFMSEHAPVNMKESLQAFVRETYAQDSASLESEPVRDAEVTLRCKDSNEEKACLISARAIFNEFGQFCGYRGTGTDVTEMMQANQRALRAETWLLDAIESSPEAFALYDKDDHLQLFNRKFLDIFYPNQKDKINVGLTFEELQDIFFEQKLSNIPADKVATWRQNRSRHRGVSEMCEYNEMWVDGRTYLAIEHRTRDGGIASFYVDITDLRAQEKSLIVAKEQAEAANNSKTEFLANISHELRTPLNAIIGFSELIRDDLAGPPNSPKYKEYIGDIHNSGMHLMELINDILDLSKAEAGMIEGTNRAVDISDIVDSCVKLMRPKAERAYVKLAANYPDELPLVWADPKHLRQIMLNLVSNAVKFTPEGGSVDIKVDINAKGMTITVKDTGIGMKPEEIPKAMQPFGQIDSSLSRKYNGTGLGLPLTKRLMEYYGGELDIKTAPNKGTSVIITFGHERLRYPNGRIKAVAE